MGVTRVAENDFTEILSGFREEYTVPKFDVYKYNCNTFTKAMAELLIEYVEYPKNIRLPGRVSNS